ncbi:MAG: glycosyltransferase, partial [Solirubrobacteraceae bacterium]
MAVVVTHDPGPWFEVTLRALASQEYESLTVLVLVTGGTTDPTALVASVLPDAFVRRLEGAGGFGAAVNQSLTMIEGAPFLLLCHDDCAPAPDAVQLMVEESFRSNAAVVCPKVVSWEDERALLHVGQSADKTGALVERVHEGERDAGQHDAVRDVFVAPGGCTLVRTDLALEVGGYDLAAGSVGDDLDLSWRAHVAGARIVVAPAAVVRHLELVSSGRRHPPEMDAPSLQALQRRSEVATMLACYSRPHLLRVLPQAAVLAAGELLVAAVSRDRERVVAIAHGWWWNISRLRELHIRRARVARLRTAPDAELRALQARGSARLSRFVSRSVHRVPLAEAPEREPRSSASEGEEPALVPDGFGASARARLAIWLVTAAVLVFGSRDLLGTHWPLVGQFVAFPQWTSVWHHFFASGQGTGAGSTASPSPAFAALGVLGTLLVGRMGLLQAVVVLGCVPLGAWGVSRLMRPFGSARARVAATLSYLALPLAFDALSVGQWDGLVAYAAMPWILGVLARASGLEPFGDAERPEHASWRRTLLGRSLALGVIEAAAVSVAPAVALDVLLAGVGIAFGSLLVGGRRRGARSLAAAGCSTVVAGVLCAPWLAGTVRAGWQALAVFGLPASPSSQPGWSGLLRLGVGPIGTSPLAWLLLGVAVVPLVLARRSRYTWSVRLWSVAALAWLVALVAAKSWAAPFAPSVDVLLAPAAVAIAGGVGLAVASFERDVTGHRFGWRQGLVV